MTFERAECNGCGRDKWIVNRTHKLCKICNQVRLSSQRTVKKTKPVRLKPAPKLKSMSSKREQLERDYRRMQAEIKTERDPICQGCGRSDRPLSFSHLVPRSWDIRLLAEKKNIHIHCITFGGEEGCHEKHEQKRWDELNDGEQILEAIKQLDSDYYKQITNE